ncbi:putative acyltransferase (DUF342 family) [Paucibacter oligotrophus]|uniref:Putative acyltransferase (DUF342 family) n=1 Tax=Roseateles oligotrophus TaxID=1769250 RepID=A0A840L3W9_9BURK|nr:DUF6701 domain-containing protein [Roseateles oligotrophus]MBB4841553.1 putative acyltransferase (DUF342 family) [Roseateles oligotrophus]
MKLFKPCSLPAGLAWLALLLLLGLPSPAAWAAAYSFPGNLPAGCTAAGATYTCGPLVLAQGDTVSIGSPKPATIRINGSLDVGNNVIFNGGSSSDLTLFVSGTLSLGYQSLLRGKVEAASVLAYGAGTLTAGSLSTTGNGSIQLLDSCSSELVSSVGGAINVGARCTITGNLVSNSGAITVGYIGQVKGSISSAGAINLDQAAVITGDVSSSASTVDLGYQTSVSGNISAAARITLGQASQTGGNVSSSGGGAVNLGYQTQVNGNISSSGTITVGQAALIGGKVTGGSGAISFDFAAKVSGEVSSSSGSISFAQSSIAQACVRSTGSASISLGYLASINSVCCGSSCGNSCVSNNTGSAMPPACLPTPIAEYRFDECSYNGTSSEVKDARGSYPATAVLGATTAGASPVVVDRYADLSASTGRRYISPNSSIPIPTNWSISSWLRLPFSSGGSRYHVLAAVSGGGDLLYLDGNNGFLWGSYTPGTTVNGSFKFNTLSNGWHHVGLVGTGNKTSLYIDGVFKETVNLQAKGNLAFVGASWDADQGTQEGINTQMDEFLVFNSALGAAQISAIYNNQLAGKNHDGSARNPSACNPAVASFVVTATAAASTCSPKNFSVTAKDASGNTLSSYIGSINLATSTNRGDFSAGSGPSPSGTLLPGTANTGRASYTFAAGDAGVVNLRLSHGLAQDLSISVQDSVLASATGSSGTLQFRDTAFVWSEDLGNKIAGSNIAVAGRNHDLQVALWKKDSVTGNCAIATDYSGSRNLKLWRSDSAGPWTAPAISSPALTIPAARPASNNLLNTSFSNGVASLTLTTSDIGKYALNLDDDSLLYAATTISGGLGPLTVRPFALVVNGLSLGGVSNPAGSLATDAKFGVAGASFSATLGAYRWSSTADAGNDGQVDSGASLSQVTAGGLAPSYSTAITLSPLSGSQTPSIGVLGSLSNSGGSNPAIGGFSGGQVTVSDLRYSEVGSFALNTSAVVQNFLGTAGLNLDASVFAGTAQNNRIGRFVPAGFVASNAVLTQRQAAACSPASTFSYLGEDFRIAFTLTAQNAQGATTQNYTDVFAKQDLSALNPAGIQGSTPFKSGGRLLASSTGGWSLGQASPVLTARVSRLSTPDGPFASANFGIAPVDADGVAMRSLDLDTDSPANGNDRSSLKTAAAPTLALPVPLRFGQLRLQNAIGPATRDLNLPVQAQYWNGTNFITNTDDSCTSIDSKAVNFGNYRKTLAVGDGSLISKTYQLKRGESSLTLSRPGGGRSGSLDVALSLNSLSDQSCLQTWSPSPAATASASLAYLQGAWCGVGTPSYVKDPSARASFGLFRGSDNMIYQRENY